jgi:hypothetical protein
MNFLGLDFATFFASIADGGFANMSASSLFLAFDLLADFFAIVTSLLAIERFLHVNIQPQGRAARQ